MPLLPHNLEVSEAPAEEATTIAQPNPTKPTGLVSERLLAGQAMELLMRLDKDLREARAQWNHDWFRRVMRVRAKAVARLKRRWSVLNPPPAIVLGDLGRRYHANIAKYLKHVEE